MLTFQTTGLSFQRSRLLRANANENESFRFPTPIHRLEYFQADDVRLICVAGESVGYRNGSPSRKRGGAFSFLILEPSNSLTTYPRWNMTGNASASKLVLRNAPRNRRQPICGLSKAPANGDVKQSAIKSFDGCRFTFLLFFMSAKLKVQSCKGCSLFSWGRAFFPSLAFPFNDPITLTA